MEAIADQDTKPVRLYIMHASLYHTDGQVQSLPRYFVQQCRRMMHDRAVAQKRGMHSAHGTLVTAAKPRQTKSNAGLKCDKGLKEGLATAIREHKQYHSTQPLHR